MRKHTHTHSLTFDVMPAKKKQKTTANPIDKWYLNRHVVSVKDFGREQIDRLFEVCETMKKIVDEDGGCDLLKNKVLCTLFYEPSTRTHMSFQAAMFRLGGTVLAISETKNTSVAKGETLEDTVKCMECYCDIMVMRHPEIGSAAKAAAALSKPLLNGGDGAGEHPTQALLDAYTMFDELGKVDGLTITMVGDLKYGRTVHSLAQVLKHFKVKLNYVSPDFLAMPQYIQDDLKKAGVEQHTTADLASVIAETDILYVTRVQKERFEKKT